MSKLLLIEGIDPAELSECIAAAVVDAMKPVLAESSRPLLCDGDEMARLAGISRPLIDRLRASGAIPSVLIGRRRLYRPDAVIAALESATEEPQGSGQGSVGGDGHE